MAPFSCPDVFLKENMTLADRLYNLQLIQEFCKDNLNNCCHFTLEDMLYASSTIKVLQHHHCISCISHTPLVYSTKMWKKSFIVKTFHVSGWCFDHLSMSFALLLSAHRGQGSLKGQTEWTSSQTQACCFFTAWAQAPGNWPRNRATQVYKDAVF